MRLIITLSSGGDHILLLVLKNPQHWNCLSFITVDALSQNGWNICYFKCNLIKLGFHLKSVTINKCNHTRLQVKIIPSVFFNLLDHLYIHYIHQWMYLLYAYLFKLFPFTGYENSGDTETSKLYMYLIQNKLCSLCQFFSSGVLVISEKTIHKTE